MWERYEELINGFVDNNLGVSNFFIPEPLFAALRNHLEEQYFDGQFTVAGIGDVNNRVVNSTIRRDKIFWIDSSTKIKAEQEFIELVEGFILYLNRTCYTGINAYEFHYAVYEPGTFYKRHKDQFKTNSARKFSLVSYLNDDWQETDGGNLMLYPNEETIVSIPPTAGKTVFFKSDEMEHEVAVCTRPRLSITGWLKRV